MGSVVIREPFVDALSSRLSSHLFPESACSGAAPANTGTQQFKHGRPLSTRDGATTMVAGHDVLRAAFSERTGRAFAEALHPNKRHHEGGFGFCSASEIAGCDMLYRVYVLSVLDNYATRAPSTPAFMSQPSARQS